MKQYKHKSKVKKYNRKQLNSHSYVKFLVFIFFQMSNIFQEVAHKHASINTIYHCLYSYYILGKSQTDLARDFKKNKSTISRWIAKYESDGFVSRKERAKIFRSISVEKRSWIIGLFQRNPTIFLSEAKIKYEAEFNDRISVSSICRILHAEGLSYKALERRAIQINELDIIRFCKEILSIPWDLSSLVFLDEVSIDNRSLWRNHGYGVVGQKLIFRGEFNRKPRVSLLCFMGQKGIVDFYTTQGTFTRRKFFDCCREFALSGIVKQYPGKHSIWIMDGAKIHCDPYIVMYLRSLGIIPLFLPAYCPFFNPIEVLFGLIKRFITKHYVENGPKSMDIMVMEALSAFISRDCTNIFRKCGYTSNSRFDVTKGLSNDEQNV